MVVLRYPKTKQLEAAGCCDCKHMVLGVGAIPFIELILQSHLPHPRTPVVNLKGDSSSLVDWEIASLHAVSLREKFYEVSTTRCVIVDGPREHGVTK